MTELTRVDYYGGWWAKRDDLACYTGDDYPSGSKVRQYTAMAAVQPGVPMIVGCSADSAMQIYVAAAAKQAGVPGIVYTAKRKTRTAATEYALAMEAEVVEVAPGYLTQCRARARERARQLGACVRWNVGAALEDAAAQTANLPPGVARVVVPTGSGLVAAVVIAGMARRGMRAGVLIVATSGMASVGAIRAMAAKMTPLPLPPAELVRCPEAYGGWVAARLPGGDYLDPYYAAKALRHARPGDCLWLPGRRPLAAVPGACRKALEANRH